MADSSPRESLELDFGNLPLVEAAVRASFESPVNLTFRIINGVHEHLRDDFPLISEPQQIEVPPGVGRGTIAMGPGQIPGVVYTGNPYGLAVSVQGQVVVARWLKQAVGDSPEYPRFKVLRDALWKAVHALGEECGTRDLPVVVVNMSYVNFLDVKASANVLKRYFSRLVQIELIKDAEQLHKVEFSWREPESVDLRFSVEQVSAKVDERTLDGYRLTTAAGVRLTEAPSAEPRLDEVHHRLQSFFVDLISEHAKTEWQLKEDPNG